MRYPKKKFYFCQSIYQDHLIKERKEITLPHLSEPLHVKKVNTSSLSKILRGNVYVISKNQYDALQDGFKEEKIMCTKQKERMIEG